MSQKKRKQDDREEQLQRRAFVGEAGLLMEMIGAAPGDVVTLVFPADAPGQQRGLAGQVRACTGPWVLIEQGITQEIDDEITDTRVLTAFNVEQIEQARLGGPLRLPKPRRCEKCKEPYVPSSKVDVLCQRCRSVVPAGGPVIVGGGNA